MFPPGCLDLKHAVEQVSQAVSLEDLLRFDDRVQAWINTHCQALLQVCMGSSTMVKNLAPVMLQEAEAFLGESLRGTSVAEMYLTGKREEYEDTADEMIFDDLQPLHRRGDTGNRPHHAGQRNLDRQRPERRAGATASAIIA